MYRLIGVSSHVLATAQSIDKLYETIQGFYYVGCRVEVKLQMEGWRDVTEVFQFFIDEMEALEDGRIQGELSTIEAFNNEVQ
ncbi:MAG: hypothetical protein E6R03_18275 [Hyphomicrobiaceae bacterium]|nr:MAG: hypothetical protein E6R03_18275 [Hyphomicrobiaceae bacterium]